MKNYFKKFSIMFVMLLTVIGVGAIQNGIIANAATVGQQLTQPENGWQRYDDSDKNINYVNGELTKNPGYSCYSNTVHSVTGNGEVNFMFKGSELRTLGSIDKNWAGFSDNIQITVDGTNYSYNVKTVSAVRTAIVFEIKNLDFKVHNIQIKNLKNDKFFDFDAIDIDENGELLSYDESISLDKSSINLTVSDSKQLTATTTPAGLDITWTSSDSNVAEYDLATGKVIAKGVGTCTITATTVNGLTATCTVTVTKGDEPQPPVNGDANLFIELVDGQIKSYSVSNDEIAKFKQWYIDRDSTKSNKPYYEFAKGTYKDYVIHDKIDWFEVR